MTTARDTVHVGATCVVLDATPSRARIVQFVKASTAPAAWLLLLDAALIAIGLAAFRRRDLR